jgi:hypothetical protein
LQLSILANKKDLKSLKGGNAGHGPIEINSLTTSIVEYGRILEEITQLLMKSTLQGLQLALTADLQDLDCNMPLELIQSIIYDRDCDLISEYMKRLSSVKHWLEGQ